MDVRTCLRKTQALVAGTGAFLLAALVGTGAMAEVRKPNPFEQAYTAMALDFGAHQLCERIDPEAESRLRFNSPGTQIYRERSRCFLYAAVNTLNPYICQFVVEVSERSFDGSYFSRENCEKLVSDGNTFSFSITFDRQLVLTEMGYTAAEIAEAFPGVPANEAWHRFYLNAVGRDGLFQQRLGRLPDYSQEDR